MKWKYYPTLLAGTQGVLVNGNGSAAKFPPIMDIQSDDKTIFM